MLKAHQFSVAELYLCHECQVTTRHDFSSFQPKSDTWELQGEPMNSSQKGLLGSRGKRQKAREEGSYLESLIFKKIFSPYSMELFKEATQMTPKTLTLPSPVQLSQFAMKII